MIGLSLRLRLALLFAAGTALLIAVAGAGFALQLHASLNASMDSALRARATSLTTELHAAAHTPVALADIRHAQRAAQLVTSSGTVTAASSSAGTAPLPDAARRAATARGKPASWTAVVRSERTRLVATRIRLRGRVLVLVVGAGTEITDAATNHVRDTLLIFGPPAVLVAGFAAWILSGASLRPVELMRRRAADISASDAATHLPVPPTHDEIARLGATMNALLDRMRRAIDREHGFVTDAGHELRTPLAILRAELELAARPGRSRDELAAAVTAAREDTDRLIRLAENLLLLARAEGAQPILRPEPQPLALLLATAARGATARAEHRHVGVESHCPTGLVVTADPDRLRQAVDNLLDNATRHTAEGTTVTVTATPGDSAVRIAITDHGPGFPPAFLPHAFERFRRADTARNRDDGGAGLGLAIVAAIVTAHGGHVDAANGSDGATVTLTVPYVAAAVPVRHGLDDHGTGDPAR